MDRVRFGVIGCGNIGEKHARILASGSVPEAELTAVCARSEARQRAARESCPGVKIFADERELMTSGAVDAVILATPHGNHPGEAVFAFSQGLHVLTEKPAGMYTAQVRPMNEAARASGKVFGIMYNQRTDPLYAALRRMVWSGELGALKRVTWIVTDWYRSLAYHRSSPWHSTWRGEGGGVLLNQSIHQLDLWQWMFGMPDAVEARAGFGKYHDIEVEDDVAVFFRYENGLTGEYITSTGETPGTNRLEIACDSGKLVAEDGALTFWKNDVSEREFERTNTEPFARPSFQKLTVPLTKPALTGHAGIIADFTSAVLHGTPLLAPGAEGIRALTLANAALLSAWTGTTVPTADFPDKTYLELLEERMEKPRG